MRFLAGVERTLARTDHALVLRVSAEPVDLGAYERLAASGRVDGFLLCDVELDDPRFELLELPAVVAGHPVSPCPFPWLETEHARGVGAAVEHLLGSATAGSASAAPASGSSTCRRASRCGARRSRRPGSSPGPSPSATPRRCSTRTSPRSSTSDLLAAAGLAAARERGIAVPGDLSITGFDDSPLAALASPPLTSVRIDYAQFGEAAAAALLAAIAGEPPPAFRGAPPRAAWSGTSTAQARSRAAQREWKP